MLFMPVNDMNQENSGCHWRITHDTIVLSNPKAVSGPVDSINEVFAAIQHWHVCRIESFMLELQDGFFIEIFGLAAYYKARYLVLVQVAEESFVLRVEPGCVKC
jgi:hypothetical protein